jgi:hypothetical protein
MTNKNKNIYFILYIIIIIFLIYSILSNDKKIIEYSITISLFLIFKWGFDYHKCTFSYIECKIMNIKKEEGFIYNFMENIININKKDDKIKILVYFFIVIILVLNTKKKLKNQ